MAWKFVVKNVHFVGIGGVGMSGIAEVMMNLGYHVTGSDIAESDTTRHLAEMGATIWLGHDASHVAGADAVVISSAVHEENPEVVEARAAYPGRSARRDARGTDAPQKGHRDCRHARQDYDDVAYDDADYGGRP